MPEIVRASNHISPIEVNATQLKDKLKDFN